MAIRLAHWISGIWKGIKKMFNKLDDKAKVFIPIAVAVVQKLKEVVESPVADVVTELIKGEWDDNLKEKAREIIPKLLLKLNMVDAIANIEDDNEKLRAILAAVKLSSNEAQNVFYHGFCSLFLQLISDGKFSWSDAVILSEYYYKHELDKS